AGGRRRKAAKRAFIAGYTFPKGLDSRLLKHHPQLTVAEVGRVFEGLRQFFAEALEAKGKFVAMPSQVVDDLWHEFILYTRNYDLFCRRGLGRFLHHTPAVVAGNAMRGSVQRTWRLACREEDIDPRLPRRLPLLFALDGDLDIPGGFRYVPDCSRLPPDQRSADTYCGATLGDSGGDGAGDGNDGDGGGDSGGSCGGGCGGGD
ncbi:MAG: hypothetical protein WBP72_10490, partial [Rhodocyclaceae bacterium]